MHEPARIIRFPTERRHSRWLVAVHELQARFGGSEPLVALPDQRRTSRTSLGTPPPLRPPRTQPTGEETLAELWTRDYPRPRQSTNLRNAERVPRFACDFAGIRLADGDRSAQRWRRATDLRCKSRATVGRSPVCSEDLIAGHPRDMLAPGEASGPSFASRMNV